MIMRRLILSLSVACMMVPLGANASANSGAAQDQPPITLSEIQSIERESDILDDDGLAFDIRASAIKEAAISYGARAGLAWRTFHIRQNMADRGKALDKVYDFKSLLIAAPSGLLIEPPIVNQSLNALIIEGDGQTAAVSDRTYNISNNARIVSTARNWRTYLEREWGVIDPPPEILRPKNKAERAVWAELTAKGWDEGVRQADEIFAEDLNQLITDFEGMIRYRALLAQGMVSAPFALHVDRGVTGGGDEMRIGDRAVQITGKSSLLTGHESWQPAQR